MGLLFADVGGWDSTVGAALVVFFLLQVLTHHPRWAEVQVLVRDAHTFSWGGSAVGDLRLTYPYILRAA